MAIHAAIELLADRSPDAWFCKIRAINPGYGEAYARVARQLELHYRYEDAVAYYRKAIEADPHLWSAHSALGIDLMRLGKEDEPDSELELSYNNGYRDAATVNSLRLLDSYKNFDTFRDGTTILKLNKSEAALLLPYIEAELHTILATYEKKYQMTLPGPVQVEVYPDHEDFAVRTMGMPGLGALGVTFGEVVAMDSPSGAQARRFQLGRNAVARNEPRLHPHGDQSSRAALVHRGTRRARRGRSAPPNGGTASRPKCLLAIRDKKLLPVAKLDRGFVYPDYPAQVIVSYFQAGSICDFISKRWGEDKLLEMVHSYAKLLTTPAGDSAGSRPAPEEFDKQYLAWIDRSTAPRPRTSTNGARS